MTRQHLETIRANKRAAEELQPRSAFSAPPQDATHRATLKLGWKAGRERVRAHMCVSSCPDLRIVFSLAAVQKARHLQIKQTGVQAAALALSLLELLFGLHIKCSISDKTSNCCSVLWVSMLTLVA